MLKFLLKIVPDMMAAIFGLLFFPWILGVPGKPSILVQWGWTTGIFTIIFYLIIYQFVKSSDRFVRLKKPAIRAFFDRLLFFIALLSIPTIALAISLVLLG